MVEIVVCGFDDSIDMIAASRVTTVLTALIAVWR